jgi:RNA polymerase sigma factor (sigma-70 family)
VSGGSARMWQDDRRGIERAVETAAAEDAACLAAIAGGDRRAFESLYRRYYERLYRFAMRVTGRVGLVEDVVHETLLVVWRKASEFRAQSSVSTWIFGIAYRKALKAATRDGRRMQALDRVPDEALATPDTTDRDGIHAAIRDAVARLPDEHRAVVDLTFFFNCSYDEIAQILGIPVGTVKSRMFHARAKLRPLLGGLLED